MLTRKLPWRCYFPPSHPPWSPGACKPVAVNHSCTKIPVSSSLFIYYLVQLQQDDARGEECSPLPCAITIKWCYTLVVYIFFQSVALAFIVILFSISQNTRADCLFYFEAKMGLGLGNLLSQRSRRSSQTITCQFGKHWRLWVVKSFFFLRACPSTSNRKISVTLNADGKQINPVSQSNTTATVSLSISPPTHFQLLPTSSDSIGYGCKNVPLEIS